MIKRMPRTLAFTDEHEMFREMTRDFLSQEVLPNFPEWEKNGMVSREIWEKAGSLGILCPSFPEKYGGAGGDFLHHVVVLEEQSKVGDSGFFISLHSDVVSPYILEYGTEEQKEKWLPGIISGKIITAIAMTEPGAGSDLSSLGTKAEDKGDHYLLNGQKTFISNGQLADLIIVAARTGNKGQSGISLLIVERGMDGFERGRNLEKIGLKAQDTSELSFSDVKIPKENVIGKANQGFRYLMQSLAQERLVLGLSNQMSAEAVLEMTVEYTSQRKAFGKRIADFQNTRFKLAEMLTEQEMSRALVDQVTTAHIRGDKTTVYASMVKLQCSEMFKRHVDTCLQFFGGYGYMLEYPIAKAFLDARVQSIYGGTSEIMKEIIAKNLGI